MKERKRSTEQLIKEEKIVLWGKKTINFLGFP